MNKKVLLEIIGEFCSGTTTHGIPNIYRSKSIYLKLFWLIVTLLSGCICLQIIITTTIDYFAYPVITTTEIIKEETTLFPSISICNLNRFYTEDTRVNSYLEDIIKNNIVQGPPNLKSVILNKIVQSNISKKEPNVRKDFGWTLEKILIFCKFNNYPCETMIDFEYFFNVIYGNCYKFNWNSTNLKSVGKAGASSALRLEIYIGNSSKDEFLTENRGLRVLIHNHTTENLYPDDDGIDVPPGKKTNIGITREFYEKLSQPYSDCIEDLSLTNYGNGWLYEKIKMLNQTQYSSSFCEKMYYQKLVESTCNCSDASIKQINDGYDMCFNSESVICQETQYQFFYSNPSKYIGNACPKGIN